MKAQRRSEPMNIHRFNMNIHGFDECVLAPPGDRFSNNMYEECSDASGRKAESEYPRRRVELP